MVTTEQLNTQQTQRNILVGISWAIGATVIAIALVSIYAGFAQAADRQNVMEAAHAALAQEVASTHVHTWQKNTELVHHDAITHQIEHPAEYETVLATHTVCNVCQEVIDGLTREHTVVSGHHGYTTGVPIAEERLVQAAWMETIVDEPEYDELITDTETCTECGSVRRAVVQAIPLDE